MAKALTFPAVTTLVIVVTPFLLYFTPWYAAGFHSARRAGADLPGAAGAGFVFFWTLLRVDPVPKAYPYLVSLWVTGAEVVGDAVLGLAVIADQNLIASAYYHALARPWGPSLSTDQVLGGGALWILGDIVGLPFLAAQLIQMIREDEAEADGDRRGTRRQGCRRLAESPWPAAISRGSGRRSAGPAVRFGPWWESASATR